MASLNKLIDLDLLETFGKGTIVPILKTIEALSTSLQALDSKVDALDANIGVLANLETTDKTNLVNAINELKAGGGGGGGSSV
jgi:prefoldin subunit 5